MLLVDDSVDVRRLLGLYLRAADAEVIEAENGRAACDIAYAAQNRRADVDLILLDMEMPELDGYAAATLLRLQGFAGPMVALTANDDAGERERCLASGCTEYLRKPVDRNVLLELVTRHVGSRPIAAASAQACASDPGVEGFLRQFLASLPEFASRIEDLLRRDLIGQLAQTVHQIKGAAGMYGFDRIHDLAAAAESRAKSMVAKGPAAADARGLRAEVDSLISVIRSTCEGEQQKTREVSVARG